MAHVDLCANCGCPARISPAALEPPPKDTKPDHFLKKPRTWWAMFPEGPIAAFLLLIAPFWAMSLFFKNHPFAAAFLVIAAGGLGYGAYRAIRANAEWGTYASILGILIVGALVASNT